MKQIDWNKFTITDNLLFQRVMRDKNLCKYLIEHILNILIRDIQYLETEKTPSGQLGKKGIRLDVYLEDEQGSVFNIEMQTSDNHRIIKLHQYGYAAERYAVLAVAQILCNFHLHLRPVSAGLAHVSIQLPVQGKSFFGNGRSDGKYFSECNGSG